MIFLEGIDREQRRPIHNRAHVACSIVSIFSDRFFNFLKFNVHEPWHEYND